LRTKVSTVPVIIINMPIAALLVVLTPVFGSSLYV
jgi:hypothetical protein